MDGDCCCVLSFVGPAPLALAVAPVSSPAGPRTGGAMSVFRAMKGVAIPLWLGLCMQVLKSKAACSHHSCWGSYVQLLEFIPCICSFFPESQCLWCGEGAAAEIWASTLKCCVSYMSYGAIQSHLDPLSWEMYEWLYFKGMKGLVWQK